MNALLFYNEAASQKDKTVRAETPTMELRQNKILVSQLVFASTRNIYGKVR